MFVVCYKEIALNDFLKKKCWKNVFTNSWRNVGFLEKFLEKIHGRFTQKIPDKYPAVILGIPTESFEIFLKKKMKIFDKSFWISEEKSKRILEGVFKEICIQSTVEIF